MNQRDPPTRRTPIARAPAPRRGLAPGAGRRCQTTAVRAAPIAHARRALHHVAALAQVVSHHARQPEEPVERLPRVRSEMAFDPTRPCHLIDQQRVAPSNPIDRRRDDADDEVPRRASERRRGQHEGCGRHDERVDVRGCGLAVLCEPRSPGIALAVTDAAANKIGVAGKFSPNGWRRDHSRCDESLQHGGAAQARCLGH